MTAAAPDGESFDIVVVGAGTAGCVVAGRLAESGRFRVLVLEAGPMDRSIWIHIPIGFYRTFQNRRINWGYQADFDDRPGARRMDWPRGKVVGGSGAINGLVHIRGQREDFADWQAAAGEGWGWEDVARCFQRAEGGPLGVSAPRWTHPLCDAFIAAAGALGHPKAAGFNGASQAGADYFQLNTRNGLRCSTAKGYLHPHRRAGRLELRTGVRVEGIDIAEGRARGVWYRGPDGARRFVAAGREVVLAAGAIGTPHLLQLSGIGPGPALAAAGVAVVRDHPRVGRNLQDHYAVRVASRVRGVRTLNEMSHALVDRLRMAISFVATRSGPLTLGAGMAGLFAAVADPTGRPDLEVMMGPLSTDDPRQGLHRFPGMTTSYCQLRPDSRGWVALASPDPAAPPRIVANYLDAERDRAMVIAGMALVRRLHATPPLAALIESEFRPGADCRSDDEVLDFARTRGGTIYHPVGTCAMGREPSAPLDVRLRLRGVDGLRVADASIMPTMVSGNTNAACVMIGERAAELMLADAATA